MFMQPSRADLEESLKSSCWTVSTSCKGARKVDTKGAASASRTTAVGVGAEEPRRNDKNDIGNMASLSSISEKDNGEMHPAAPESPLHDGKENLQDAKQGGDAVEPVARQIQDQEPSCKPLLQREKGKPLSSGCREDHQDEVVSTRSRKSAGIVQEPESKVLEMTTTSRTRSKPRGTTSPRRAAVCSPRRRLRAQEVMSPQNKPAGPRPRMTLRELTNGELSSSSSDDDVQLLTQVPTTQALDEGFSARRRKSAHLRSPTNNEIKSEHEKRRQVLMNKIAAPALSKEDMAYITRKVGTLSGRLSSPDSASPPPLARGHRRGSSSSRHHKRRGASSSAETRPHDLRIKAGPSLNSVMEKCSSQEPPLVVQLSGVDVDSASSSGVEVLRLSRSAGAANLDGHYRAGLDQVKLRDRGGTTSSGQMKNPVTAELKREQRLQYVEHMCSSIPGATSDVEVLYFHLYELQKFAKTRLQALDSLARLAVRVDVAAVETSRSKRHGRSRSANKREGPPPPQSSTVPVISRAALALTLLHNLVHEEMPATWKFRAQGEELLGAAVERLRSLKSAVAESVLEVYEGMTAQKTNAKQESKSKYAQHGDSRARSRGGT